MGYQVWLDRGNKSPDTRPCMEKFKDFVHLGCVVKNVLAEFYVPLCRHCKEMTPICDDHRDRSSKKEGNYKLNVLYFAAAASITLSDSEDDRARSEVVEGDEENNIETIDENMMKQDLGKENTNLQCGNLQRS